jgi:hypothetical protein
MVQANVGGEYKSVTHLLILRFIYKRKTRDLEQKPRIIFLSRNDAAP